MSAPDSTDRESLNAARYHAERVEVEIRQLAVLAAGKNAVPDGQRDYSGLDA